MLPIVICILSALLYAIVGLFITGFLIDGYDDFKTPVSVIYFALVWPVILLIVVVILRIPGIIKRIVNAGNRVRKIIMKE